MVSREYPSRDDCTIQYGHIGVLLAMESVEA
jgi:hypothetical protein